MSTSTIEHDTGTAEAKAVKYVYFFGDGNAEGHGKMKDELGGKGAGLAEMTNAGLPVPPGFTIQTEACREYMRDRRPPRTKSIARWTKRCVGSSSCRARSSAAPTIRCWCRVRSGAKFSMPGMMDTILNLGLNDKSVEGLAKRTQQRPLCLRQLSPLHPDVRHRSCSTFRRTRSSTVFDGKKKQKKVKLDTDLDAKALAGSDRRYKKVVQKQTKRDFPQDPREQLLMARDAVFRSWMNRARRPTAASTTSDDIWHRRQRADDGVRQSRARPAARASASRATRDRRRRSSTASS